MGVPEPQAPRPRVADPVLPTKKDLPKPTHAQTWDPWNPSPALLCLCLPLAPWEAILVPPPAFSLTPATLTHELCAWKS